jgi:hypothetical protein
MAKKESAQKAVSLWDVRNPAYPAYFDYSPLAATSAAAG